MSIVKYKSEIKSFITSGSGFTNVATISAVVMRII